MSRASGIYNSVKHEPLRVLEGIWGAVLVLNGTYLLSPDYEPAGTSVFSAFITSPAVLISVAVFYILTGLASIAGAWKNKYMWRNISITMAFFAFLFTVLLRLLSVGFVPTVWVWPLILTFVAGVDYLHLKWNRSP